MKLQMVRRHPNSSTSAINLDDEALETLIDGLDTVLSLAEDNPDIEYLPGNSAFVMDFRAELRRMQSKIKQQVGGNRNDDDYDEAYSDSGGGDSLGSVQ